MDGYTLRDLSAKLMAVRGETRVKNAESSIRQEFLQSAVIEIMQEYDWSFYEQSETITIDDDGTYEAPKTMSIMNGFSAVGTTAEQLEYTKSDFNIRMNRGKLSLVGPTEEALVLTYFIKAPDLVSNSEAKVYFPQPILIAERAYVRLKAAMFPDESNEKELAASERAVKSLYIKNAKTCVITNFGVKV